MDIVIYALQDADQAILGLEMNPEVLNGKKHKKCLKLKKPKIKKSTTPEVGEKIPSKLFADGCKKS
jgi:hypothetical protein